MAHTVLHVMIYLMNFDEFEIYTVPITGSKVNEHVRHVLKTSGLAGNSLKSRRTTYPKRRNETTTGTIAAYLMLWRCD
jgi:hypothetical protein